MTRAVSFALHRLHLAMLAGAALLVPRQQRQEWLREWTCELWHVRQSCLAPGAFSFATEWELTAFCLGSFQDAACLRRQQMDIAPHLPSAHGSAAQCILVLATVLALSAAIAKFLPGVQSEKEASRILVQPGTVLLQQGTDSGPSHGSVPFAVYRDWDSRPQRFFTALAFYRTDWENAHADGAEDAPWLVADASQNLFALLGLRAADFASGPDPALPQAFLSPSLFRRGFGSSRDVIGRVVELAGRRVRIAGIAPGATGLLPERPDVWVLESAPALARSSRAGYVLGLLSPQGQAEAVYSGFSVITYNAEGDEITLYGSRFEPRASGLSSIYFFALFLAVLALPAIVSVFRSETEVESHQPAFATRVRRSIFLAAKLALVAALACFGSLDIAYWNFPDYTPTAEFLQFVAAFLIALFGLRWALMDQSRRCPVCLRCVTHPAQVGIASCSFLGWNGTEMICTGGHALLHVPSLPTSWFAHQRWLYLDASWDFLFANAAVHPPD